MSTLNQIEVEDEIYDLEDAQAREGLINVERKAETAVSIAKGANQSLVYGDYNTMITAFNAISKDTYKIGQNILIITLNVPDLWISEITEESIEYTYTSDGDFVATLNEQGYVQVGYYKLSALETQKVDLTDCVKNTDFATSSNGGIVTIQNRFGLQMGATGGRYLLIKCATNDEIDGKTNLYNPIVPSNLKYAVESVVGGHITLTQAEYNALVEEGTVTTEEGITYTFNENTYYHIKEE